MARLPELFWLGRRPSGSANPANLRSPPLAAQVGLAVAERLPLRPWGAPPPGLKSGMFDDFDTLDVRSQPPGTKVSVDERLDWRLAAGPPPAESFVRLRSFVRAL
mmetsp:Transcript_110996/g.314121  ORF Transcript_110996/g.314121 Transcript_110996/m.314121 type:complete len:105 (-) Transcript_110996:705-1019(-)